MATQQFNIIRGGKEFQVNIGVTTDKNSVLYLEEVEAGTLLGLKERWIFGSLYVDTDESDTGKVTLIKTTWKKKMMSPTGVSIPGVQTMEVMITNEEDIAAFITMFGMPILMSMTNGLIRDIFGFNHFGVFLPNGSTRLLTSFESNSSPTWDYRTWKTGDPLPDSIIEPTEEP